jgi:hypothetical protein
MTEAAVSYQQSVFSGQFEVSTTFRLSEVGVYSLFLRVLICRKRFEKSF